MKIYEETAGKGSRFEIQTAAVVCGEDCNIIICGGSRHHVGATAIAFGKLPDGSRPKYSASVSSIAGLDHKDDIIARKVAQQLADHLAATVSVTVGIHIDDAKPQELEILQKNVNLCIEQLAKHLENSRKEV